MGVFQAFFKLSARENVSLLPLISVIKISKSFNSDKAFLLAIAPRFHLLFDNDCEANKYLMIFKFFLCFDPNKFVLDNENGFLIISCLIRRIVIRNSGLEGLTIKMMLEKCVFTINWWIFLSRIPRKCKFRVFWRVKQSKNG